MFDDVYKEEIDHIKPLISLEIEENLNENSKITSTIGNTNTNGDIGKIIKNKTIKD